MTKFNIFNIIIFVCFCYVNCSASKKNEFVCDNCGFVNYPYGDITGDLKVNIIDLVRLKKIILGRAESSGYAADLDDSGDISAVDLTILRKLLLSAF